LSYDKAQSLLFKGLVSWGSVRKFREFRLHGFLLLCYPLRGDQQLFLSSPIIELGPLVLLLILVIIISNSLYQTTIYLPLLAVEIDACGVTHIKTVLVLTLIFIYYCVDIVEGLNTKRVIFIY